MTAKRDRAQPSRSLGPAGSRHPAPEANPVRSDTSGQPDTVHGTGQRDRGLASRAAEPESSQLAQHQTEDSTLEVESGGDRAGVDARRRGWFWHWNNVVTQYAPLIGLKGVGLLNSYTVWTDRREESPHRGYAFPSQQSEADFYGEERSELITINKILVALDLIEIRKEMVLRVDERGRKWRVPHNLYRVKDRPDGADLRVIDVLRVTALARDDAAVYRYVRRVFSPRFKPIDRDNVWHGILAELADHPLWLELQLRTSQQESRASARSRAGHRTRATREEDRDVAVMTDGQLCGDVSVEAQHPEIAGPATGSNAQPSNSGSESSSIVVAETNTGSSLAVDDSNDGLSPAEPTFAAPSNTGQAASVAPSNSTYDQALTTTTTTTRSRENRPAHGPEEPPTALGHAAMSVEPDPNKQHEHRSMSSALQPTVDALPLDRAAATQSDTAHPATTARGSHSVPDGQRSSAAGERLRAQDDSDSDDANQNQNWESAADEASLAGAADGGSGFQRRDEDGATALESDAIRTTPAGLALEEPTPDRRALGAGVGAREGVGSLVDGHGGGPLGDPSALVVSLFEAANDRRTSPLERILLAELERDADPAARAAGASGAEWVAEALREAVSSGSAFVAPKRIREIITRWSRESNGPERASARPESRTRAQRPVPAQDTSQSPSQTSGQRVDPAPVRLPGGADGATVWAQVLAELARLLDASAFERLLGGSTVSRFRQGTVEVQVTSQGAAEKLSAEYRPLVERHLNARLPRAVAVSFVWNAPAIEPAVLDAPEVVDLGNITIVISRSDYDLASRVWQAIRDDLAAVLPARDLDGLGTVVPLGEDAGGVMLLGTTSSRSQRLIDGRCRAEIERALAALLGRAVTVRAVAGNDWSVEPES